MGKAIGRWFPPSRFPITLFRVYYQLHSRLAKTWIRRQFKCSSNSTARRSAHFGFKSVMWLRYLPVIVFNVIQSLAP